jgi:NADH:ubiquinone oxidoreductase subunit 2 (subunit N)
MTLGLSASLLPVGLVALALAATVSRPRAGWWGFAIAVVAATLAGRALGGTLIGAAIGALGELAALGLLLAEGTAEARAAARTWSLALLAGIAAVAAGLVAIDFGHTRPAAPWGTVAVGLLMLGFALKLALVPLYFWLAPVARAARGATLILILGVVDTGVVADLAELAEAAPWIFADHLAVWRAIAVLSLLGGAALALAETDLKAIVAFTGPVDAAMILLALLAPDAATRDAVALGLAGHALALAALFGAIAVGESGLGRSLSIADVRGLAGRQPVASAVFMVGVGALLGLPPSLGFSAHWRVFQAALEVGGPVLVGLVFVAVALLLLTFVRALHRVWLGPSQDTAARPAPLVARAVLVAVAIAVVATGLTPRLFETGAAPQGLALVEGYRK